MPKLVAKVAFTYANKSLQPGDAFEASDKDARVLKLIKRAADTDVADPSPQAQLASDRLNLEHPAAVEPRRTRRYQRRDMTAEEE